MENKWEPHLSEKCLAVFFKRTRNFLRPDATPHRSYKCCLNEMRLNEERDSVLFYAFPEVYFSDLLEDKVKHGHGFSVPDVFAMLSSNFLEEDRFDVVNISVYIYHELKGLSKDQQLIIIENIKKTPFEDLVQYYLH